MVNSATSVLKWCIGDKEFLSIAQTLCVRPMRLASLDWSSRDEKSVDNPNEYLGRFVLTKVGPPLPENSLQAHRLNNSQKCFKQRRQRTVYR